MRILQLTKKVPYPLKDGESIAVTQIAKGLVALGCKIDLLSFNSIKHHINFDIAKLGMTHYNRMEDVFLDNRVKMFPALLNIFTNVSYNIIRFYNKNYEKKLIAFIQKEEYDIILIESLFMCSYIDTIKSYSKAKIIMRSHNIEYHIWERLAENESFFIKKWYLSLLTKRLKEFEENNISKYDLLVPISQKDDDFYKIMHPSINSVTIPTGVDTKTYIDCKSELHNPVRFFFLGSLDWAPNIEGVKWFLENVWKNKTFRAELHIAGRNCPNWLTKLNEEDVYIVGEVEEAHKFICNNDIMIVPLFSGSGIRIKIIESMALGKPVISTTIGMEGINAVNYIDIYQANTASEFISSMKSIVSLRADTLLLSRSAQRFIFKEFDQESLSKLLFDRILRLI